ncbi:Fc.00g011780.m01.CDS01 [Cosmosporella sp. VM-42]
MSSDDSQVHTVEWRCLKCRRIPWDYGQWLLGSEGTIIDHHDSVTALEEPAASGCYLCRTFRAQHLYEARNQQIQPGRLKIKLKLPNHRDNSVDDDGDGDECVASICIGEKSHSLVTKQSNLPTEHLDVIRSQFGALTTLKRFAPETLDLDLARLAKDRIHLWIRECLSGSGRHEKCAHRKLKQDESFDLPKNGPTKTTRANLEERRQHINPADLPKTIQDAIKVTRLMVIRYLWVDAICIIQPHPGDKYLDDWMSEASKMGSYYSNSHCLISALSASDSSQGLFKERLSEKYPTKSCTIAFDFKANKYIYTPVPRPDFLITPNSSISEPEPLITRSWCLQERLLSSRALHWSSIGLFWQCLGVFEDSEFTPMLNRVDGLEGYEPALEAMQQIFTASGDEAMGKIWTAIVSEYNTMGLTYKTDRLAAIQGLGNQVATLHQTEYFAGLFLPHICRGLLWEAPSSDVEREKLTHFPTWSWASCYSRHGVTFNYFDNTWVRCTRPDVFPLQRRATDFNDPSKRVLRIEAPLLWLKPEQDRHEHSFVCK